MSNSVVGHLFTLEWFNPYTSPPGNEPRLLAGYFIPTSGACPGTPPEISTMWKPGTGYSVIVRSLSVPVKPQSPEKLSRLRKKTLRRKITERYPMFADEFFQQSLEHNPDYFEGRSLRDAARDNALEHHAAIIAYWVERPHQLIHYPTHG